MKRDRKKTTDRAQPRCARRDQALVGDMLALLKAGADLRRAKVRRVRAAVRDQSYVNLLKLEVAAQRLADEMIS